MTLETIAILMPGDMGHAVGRSLREHGHDVITCLSGRGNHTRTLAEAGGLRDVETLNEIVKQADLILSILPPSAAIAQAELVATAMQEVGKIPAYVDCNAISPQTALQVGDAITKAGGNFIDAGIIGLAPGHGAGPRFYISGPDHAPMLALNGKGFTVISMGERIGEASAIKMAYAALTKGTWTLHTAVLLAAQKLGVTETLFKEFENSQPAAMSAMRARVPFLPADSGRWIGEMEEIAATFADTGVTSGFHDGAADIFRVLSQTPFADETRQTMDKSRTLEEALKVFERYVATANE